MKIIVSNNAGFCHGVKRALDMAYHEATQSADPVYTYGPLVHNQQVISYLEDLGIEPVDKVEQLPPGSHVIIRSHGIGPGARESIESRNLTIVDATCSRVKNVQDLARRLMEDGYSLIILGAPEHPEIKAIREYVHDQALVIDSLDEIVDPLFEEIPDKVGVVCQTTLSYKFFEEAIHKIQEQIPNVEFHNTICGATNRRQHEALSVAQIVDLMIVIGSPVSSNTSKLAELCAEFSVVKKIETENDLVADWFTENMTVGVTAGASTPDWIIKMVIKKIVETGETLDGVAEVLNADKYL